MLLRSGGVETENKWLTMQNGNKSQNDYQLQDGAEHEQNKKERQNDSLTLESQTGTDMARGAEREQYRKQRQTDSQTGTDIE